MLVFNIFVSICFQYGADFDIRFYADSINNLYTEVLKKEGIEHVVVLTCTVYACASHVHQQEYIHMSDSDKQSYIYMRICAV